MFFCLASDIENRLLQTSSRRAFPQRRELLGDNLSIQCLEPFDEAELCKN